VAGLGAGVGTQVAHRGDSAADRPVRASERTAERAGAAATAPIKAQTAGAPRSAADRPGSGRTPTTGRKTRGRGGDRVAGSGVRSGTSLPATRGGNGTTTTSDPVKDATAKIPSAPSAPSGTSTPSVPTAQAPATPKLDAPKVQLPTSSNPSVTVDLSPTVDSVAGTVQGTAENVTGTVDTTVDSVTQPIQDTTGIKLP